MLHEMISCGSFNEKTVSLVVIVMSFVNLQQLEKDKEKVGELFMSNISQMIIIFLLFSSLKIITTLYSAENLS